MHKQRINKEIVNITTGILFLFTILITVTLKVAGKLSARAFSIGCEWGESM